jgi:hypothetical protein
MLPILKAFAFQEFALKGGSNQPCIVSVTDENGVLLQESYVVKIFKKHTISHTCKEVYAAILAQHFDLKTPQPVLIEVNQSLINELKKQPKYQNWFVTEGVYFGSKYLSNVKSFTQTSALNRYNYWELSNIFAFDVLIMNSDRQVEKPNVIIQKQDIFVIDHELSLNISNSFDFYLAQKHWDYSIKNNRGGHLFRNQLQKRLKKNKLSFDEFIENLRALKPKRLYDYAEQLIEYDYTPLNLDKIVAYLTDVKRGETKFLNLLNDLIR